MKSLIDLTTVLIESRSISSDNKSIKAIFDYLNDLFLKEKLQTKLYQQNGVYSLLAATEIKTEYEYILLGHIDVVPAKDEAFLPYVDDSHRLHGRGAFDMLSENAAMIMAMIDLKKEDVLSDTALLLTSDEEIGGFNGAKYMIETIGIRAKCAFVPDGGFYDKLCTGEKGVLHVKVHSEGVGAHGSRPWLGENAITKLMDIFTKIEAKIPNSSADDNWNITVNLGKIEGGTATNSVPVSATMYLDFRYPLASQRAELLELVEQSLKGMTASYEITVEGLPTEVDLSNEYVTKFKELGKKHGIEFGEFKTHGGSDARFFTPFKTPVIMIRPKGSDAHADDEWVDLDSLDIFYTLVKEFIKKG